MLHLNSKKEPQSTYPPAHTKPQSGGAVRLVDCQVYGGGHTLDNGRARVQPPSCCCCRPDGKVAYGYSLFRGNRSNMEDFHHAQVQPNRRHATASIQCLCADPSAAPHAHAPARPDFCVVDHMHFRLTTQLRCVPLCCLVLRTASSRQNPSLAKL